MYNKNNLSVLIIQNNKFIFVHYSQNTLKSLFYHVVHTVVYFFENEVM